MRIIFFSSDLFGIPTLKLLHQIGFEIVKVVTAPPRPQGRGQKLKPTPIATFCRKIGIDVLTPEDPNDPNFVEGLTHYAPDCGILVAYGVILRKPLLNLPEHGFINLHPSLLPRYRGPAPIPRQLMDGCRESGVTVIKMDQRIDGGEILNQIRVPVDSEETAGELKARLAQIGAELIYTTLMEIEKGSLKGRSQEENQATFAPKLTPADRVIDWQKSAWEIHNQIRALSPKPGAVTKFRGNGLIIIRSRVLNDKTRFVPGSIVNQGAGLAVATGSELLELLQLKPAGRNVLTGSDFRNGYRPQEGEKMGDSHEKV
ncbi:MAG: methionyl-tRNA formyltransferase [bacterium]